MMTIMQYQSDLQEAYGILRDAKTDYAELRLLCLWSVAGLTLTGLFFAMGFGDEIAQALIAAG